MPAVPDSRVRLVKGCWRHHMASDLDKDEIIDLCSRRLAPYKVPALIRFVPSLAVTAGGKLARNG